MVARPQNKEPAVRPPALILVLSLFIAAPAAAQSVPRAVTEDPAPDAQHPARMEVIHVPSGGVDINGVVYVASGPGPHPTFVLFHGLPGNEKNLDLAQAARRAGWIAVTFNYRGSWGSPGRFSFAHVLEDTAATLAFLREPGQMARLGGDPARIVLAGHSMGGWATLLTAALDHALRGAVVISPADMGAIGLMPHDRAVAMMTDNSETLVTTPEAMADDAVHAPRFADAAPGLAHTRLLVLTSYDGLAPAADTLAATLRREGNGQVTTAHVATDHGWSDHRIALETAILDWLDALR